MSLRINSLHDLLFALYKFTLFALLLIVTVFAFTIKMDKICIFCSKLVQSFMMLGPD